MKKKIKVILQARTGSKRLYGKVLLPICGISLVVLCWKRLKKKNFDITVAIPKNKEDNKLASILKKNKIKFFRGEKKNVLSRFKKITSKMHSNEDIVRVTADNPIVDSFFLSKVYSIFKANKFEYFSAHDNLLFSPYGLQVEVFKVKHLREKIIQSNRNLEHVTPSIRNKYKSKKKINLKNLKDFKNLRITIDTKKDYKKIKNIFKVSFNDYKKNYLDLLRNYHKSLKKT